MVQRAGRVLRGKVGIKVIGPGIMEYPMTSYPRNMIGCGGQPPHARWPGRSHCAAFVINYEDGGENAIVHGDPATESFLTELIGA